MNVAPILLVAAAERNSGSQNRKSAASRGKGKDTELQRGRFPGGLEKGPLDDRMQRRKMADRVGGGGVAGQEEGLAAAAAEVDLAPLTASARLGHPVRAAKAPEHRGVEPDAFERGIPDVGERQARDLARGLTGQDCSVRRNGQKDAPPAV